MEEKKPLLIYAVSYLVMVFAFIFLLMVVPIGIADLHFKIFKIPNELMHSNGTSLFSTVFAFIFSISFMTIPMKFLKKLKYEEEFHSNIRIPLIVMGICIICIYSNFWAISKDKIYFSSIPTLDFNKKYDYKDVSNISISVIGAKAGPLLKVNLIVKGHQLNLKEGNAKDETIRALISTLKTKHHVPIEINTHGYDKYDNKINYLLGN